MRWSCGLPHNSSSSAALPTFLRTHHVCVPPLLSCAFGGVGPQDDSPAPTSERTAEHQGSSPKNLSCPRSVLLTKWVGSRDVEQPAPLVGPEQLCWGGENSCPSPSGVPRSLQPPSVLSWDFPGGSDGKESAYNAGDLGSILSSKMPNSKQWKIPTWETRALGSWLHCDSCPSKLFGKMRALVYMKSKVF